MIQIGSRVKVLPHYSGGLNNVMGETAKIVKIDITSPEVHNRYVLDIEGERIHSYSYGGSETTYKRSHPVIVDGYEIEEVPYDFKDAEGNLVEIGDTVVYASYGGGITKGVVVDFKDKTYSQWGDSRDELKMKVEYESTYTTSDGDVREIETTETRTQWFLNQNQTLIIKKYNG